MKACVCPEYGPPDVLQLTEVDAPVPEEDQILVRVVATEVTSGDDRIRGAKFPSWFAWLAKAVLGFGGPRKPILGVSFSGAVAAIGANVERFEVGDQVFGSTGHDMGCHAEYISVSQEAVITHKPQSVSHSDAAALFFGAHTALHFLSKGNVKEGDRVLVYGASGCLGTFGVQLASHLGAEVIGVCSTPNVELVRSLGASEVLDYTDREFTLKGRTFDAVFDAVGLSPFADCIKALKPDGAYLRAVHIDFVPVMNGLWHSRPARYESWAERPARPLRASSIYPDSSKAGSFVR